MGTATDRQLSSSRLECEQHLHMSAQCSTLPQQPIIINYGPGYPRKLPLLLPLDVNYVQAAHLNSHLTSRVVIHKTSATAPVRWRGLVISCGVTPLSQCPSYIYACLNMLGCVAVTILPVCPAYSVTYTLRPLTYHLLLALSLNGMPLALGGYQRE